MKKIKVDTSGKITAFIIVPKDNPVYNDYIDIDEILEDLDKYYYDDGVFEREQVIFIEDGIVKNIPLPSTLKINNTSYELTDSELSLVVSTGNIIEAEIIPADYRYLPFKFQKG